MQNATQVIQRLCPNCSQNNQTLSPTDYGNSYWPIKQCQGCGFVYLEKVPVYELLSNTFAWEKTSQLEKSRRMTNEPLKQWISQKLKIFRHRWLKRSKLTHLIQRYFKAGNVLDIGCAAGGLLNTLDQQFIPHGIEISEALAHKAQHITKARGGYIVHNDALSGIAEFPSNFFSGIIMSAFLEHEINPKLLLNEAYRTLSPGGNCIIKVPNYASVNRIIRGAKWCGFRLPDHVNYFTPNSLLTMCKNAGFNVQQFGWLDRLPTSDNMWIVLQKR